MLEQKDINTVAMKMKMLGADVEILTDSTLLQSTKGKGTVLYKIGNGKIVEKQKYSSIERIRKTEICVTESYSGLKGLIDIHGNIIVSPGYKDIDTSNNLVIIATLDNGLKSILKYDGTELTPYILRSVKIIDTDIGYIIDADAGSNNANLILIEVENKDVRLRKLDNINNEISDKPYVILEDKVVIIDKSNKRAIKYNEWRA